MNKELIETVSIVRFILDNTKRKWYDNLEILIKIKYNKGDRFTSKDIYEKFENILQQKYPLNYTIKSSIRANLQVLRDKDIIDYIDNKGNYILIN
jgi:type II restriction enzyme|tara:strand:+ start:167 stop:451 length:285 start_codon:yes stop_codon:yes gene_type:complete